MFLGKDTRSVDAKGRLAIQAKFREQLPTGSVVTIGPDGALRVYPPHEWESVSRDLTLSTITDSAERNLVRRLFAEASELEFDSQGRALIPASLRAQAGITTSCVVSGANNIVEIWSEARWHQLEGQTTDFTGLADQVAKARAQQPGA